MAKSVQHLCVDLDGTLLKTDTLLESILLFIKARPFNIFRCLAWLASGKSRFKHKLAVAVDLNVAALPINQDLLAYLQTEAKTRQLHLCTAANQKIADAVAKHLGIFTNVYASSEERNLKGDKKADVLIKDFGVNGFSYAGNEAADLKIWQHAASAIVVSNSKRLLANVQRVTDVTAQFDAASRGITKYLRALRLHQWVKNTLIFLPLVLAHKYTALTNYVDVLLGFIAFGLVASANYMLNDLLDLDADRVHATKRNRPFAAGDLSIKAGITLIPVMLLLGLGLSYQVSLAFFTYALIYIGMTAAYSYIVKSIVILDIIVLASLYTLRLVAGAAAIHEPVTFWLLAYSLFIFLSLASVKRYAELAKLDYKEKVSGRGYTQEDLSFVKILGISSGLISVLVFALYINDPGIVAKYDSPVWLWMITPLLLYWITRVWHLAYHGKMHDDPVVFAIKDKISYILAGLILFSVVMAV